MKKSGVFQWLVSMTEYNLIQILDLVSIDYGEEVLCDTRLSSFILDWAEFNQIEQVSSLLTSFLVHSCI